MAGDFNLQHNEAVLLQETSVRYGSLWAGNNDTLVLTNLNLLLVRKNVFGRTKEVLTFPLSEIRVYEGQVQAMKGKASNGTKCLHIYFRNGQEEFQFLEQNRRNYDLWIAKINYAITGVELQVEQSSIAGFASAGAVVGALKDSFGVFKARLGGNSSKDTESATPVRIAGKCSGCGAPLSGFQGHAVTCDYCGSAQQL